MPITAYYRIVGCFDVVEDYKSLEALKATLNANKDVEFEYINVCNEDDEIMFSGIKEIMAAE